MAGRQISTCWQCLRQLVRLRGGGFIHALVRDPMGNDTRVHKQCVADAVGHGYTEVQPEIASSGTSGTRKRGNR